MQLDVFFFNDTATTEIYTFPYTTLFRSLPERIRSDNGPPFATTGVAGLSRPAIWGIRLGIRPGRIERGKAQQKRRHQRKHRTPKHAPGKEARTEEGRGGEGGRTRVVADYLKK